MSQLGLNRVVRDMTQEESNFATALGRGTESMDHLLCLRLVLDLDWKIKTPLTFLNKEHQLRLREILEGPGLARDLFGSLCLVDRLRKPPVNQVKLFEQFGIPAQERGIVVKIARELLLETPELVEKVDLLGEHLEARIRALQDQGSFATVP